MRKLFTIGYEGANPKDFIRTLQEAKVTMLLDVREIPISRRRGFSKSALRDSLEQVGIDYQHEKLLGSPKTTRHRLREDKNYQRFFKDFDRHLNEQWDLLESLSEALKGNIALMCYEKDYRICHRTAVANALGSITGKSITHLGVHAYESTTKTCYPAYPYLSEGFSPA